MLRPTVLTVLVAMLAWLPLRAAAMDTVDVTVIPMTIAPGSTVEGSRASIFDPVPETWTLGISGMFDLRITDYGFGCSSGPFAICADHFSTIQLVDPNVTVDTAPERPLIFPIYRATFNSPPTFSGNDGPCSVTLPGEHCSGSSSGPLASFDGSFDGATLLLTGIDPAPLFGEVAYAYDLTATASAVTVPLPGGLMPMMPALGVVLLRARRPQRE